MMVCEKASAQTSAATESLSRVNDLRRHVNQVDNATQKNTAREQEV